MAKKAEALAAQWAAETGCKVLVSEPLPTANGTSKLSSIPDWVWDVDGGGTTGFNKS
jgi:hypothetical protein